MRLGRSWRGSRLGICAVVVLGLASTMGACSRTVTHEPDRVSYDGYDQGGGATYTALETSAAGVPAYTGDTVGRAQTPGDVAAAERGLGILDVSPDAPYGYEGWYAAAFYFPNGTFTGAAPDQRGDIEIMRWNGTAGEFGGIEIRADHRARLVRGGDDSVTAAIGDEFPLAEGCWNWIAVHQRISTGADATNEVWLNGQRVATGYGTPNTSRQTAVTDVRFGYSSRDAAQDRPLTYFVDDATIGSTTSDLSKPQAGVCGQPAPGVERPNVLVIMTDDQRAGTEDSRLSTPGSPYLMEAIRARFMAEGEMYEQAFSTTPQCCPSRASIFTGRYAHNHDVIENRFTINLGHTEDSPGQQTTLQHYLKTKVKPGYRTAIFGKYLNGWPSNQKPPFFDDWATYGVFNEDDPATPVNEEQPHLSRSTITPDVCETSGPNFEPSEACMIERSPTGANVRKPLPSGVYETDFVADKAASFLAEAEDGGPAEDSIPWLMYLTPTIPHAPHTPQADSPDYRNLPVSSFDDDVPAESLEADRGDKPRSVRDTPIPVPRKAAQAAHDAHLRMQKSIDDMVANVFDELDRRGETNTTLAFFLSDNGYLWGEHGLAGKRRPYRESVQIPLMVRWPGHPAQAAAGARDQRLAANIDVAPTVMRAVGLDPAAQTPPMDGVSLFDSGARSRLLIEAWVKDPLPGSGGLRPLCEEQGYCRPEGTPPTLPGETVPSADPGTWAGTITGGPNGYHYTRYYLYDPATDPPLENRPVFREFFLNTDTFQLDNLYGADGTPGGGDDLGSPPPEGILGDQLERDRRCQGHGPPGSWPPPCP